MRCLVIILVAASVFASITTTAAAFYRPYRVVCSCCGSVHSSLSYASSVEAFARHVRSAHFGRAYVDLCIPSGVCYRCPASSDVLSLVVR